MKINFSSILGLIKNNWRLKVSAFVIAIVVWFIVVQYVNPEDTRKIENISIEVNTVDSVPVAKGLILVGDYDETVSITYTAGRDTIAMLDVSKIKAYVDLSTATKAGTNNYDVKIDTGGQNIKIVDQSVKQAKLVFENRISEAIPIKTVASGIVPEGYLKDEPETAETLKIDGPESIVKRIKTVEAVIPETTFTQSKSYECEYHFLDENGDTVSKEYITAEQDKITADVTVLKTKEVPIKGTLINSSGGYENSFASLYISPSTILVAGEEEDLETYNSYTLGAIDVAEKQGDFTQSFDVSLESNNLRNVNNVEKIDVSVVFGDVVTKKIVFKSFNVLNAPKDKDVNIITKSCTVTFRGMADDIAKINADNIEIQIDLQNEKYGKGRHNIPIHAVIPNDYKVGVVGKLNLTVELS